MPNAANISKDCRQSTRHTVRGEAKLEPLNENLDLVAPAQVTLQDIGRTGVMFDCDRPLPLNSAWRLRILSRGHQVASLAILIRYCRAVRDGQHQIGAQLAIEPFVLSFLGVDEHEIRMEDWLDPRNASVNFVAP
jgi:hypothetical protein